MKRTILLILALIFVLGACSSPPIENITSEETEQVFPTEQDQMGAGMGMGRGRRSGMMGRHHASIPEDYADVTNPIPVDEGSLERGAELYTIHCASCHGDGGMGDGPAGTVIDPVAAPIAHTSQMLGDDYLIWRVSEGGAMAPFNSAMPAWAETLNEQERWEVISYVQALGSGSVTPRRAMGGEAFDPEAEAAQRAEMLSTAVEQGTITQAEAETFGQVHSVLEEIMSQGMDNINGNMASMQSEILAEMVKEGAIDQAQADTFNNIHDRLLESGLMQ